MSWESCESLPVEAMTDTQVANYLLANPGFFVSHSWLLEHIRIPHDCGAAESLIEHQVHLLRQTNRTLCDQIDTLIRIARNNDALLRNMHELTLALFQAEGLSDMAAAVEDCLRERFQLEWVALRLFQEGGEEERLDLFLNPVHIAAVKRVLDAREPYIGTPSQKQLECLFQGQVAIRSCALVPIELSGPKAILAIGSQDRRRFWPGLGKVYLARLGELIGARTEALLTRG